MTSYQDIVDFRRQDLTRMRYQKLTTLQIPKALQKKYEHLKNLLEIEHNDLQREDLIAIMDGMTSYKLLGLAYQLNLITEKERHEYQADIESLDPVLNAFDIKCYILTQISARDKRTKKARVKAIKLEIQFIEEQAKSK